MLEGIARKTGRGLPQMIKQQEETTDERIEQAVRTVKAAECSIIGIPKKILAVSVYDSKPVYFLPSSATEIKWVKLTRKVWVEKTLISKS